MLTSSFVYIIQRRCVTIYTASKIRSEIKDFHASRRSFPGHTYAAVASDDTVNGTSRDSPKPADRKRQKLGLTTARWTGSHSICWTILSSFPVCYVCTTSSAGNFARWEFRMTILYLEFFTWLDWWTDIRKSVLDFISSVILPTIIILYLLILWI